MWTRDCNQGGAGCNPEANPLQTPARDAKMEHTAFRIVWTLDARCSASRIWRGSGLSGPVEHRRGVGGALMRTDSQHGALSITFGHEMIYKTACGHPLSDKLQEDR